MKITHLVIHCSDSRWGNIEEIDRWHAEKGYRRARSRAGNLRHVGYQKVITNAHPLSSRRSDHSFDGQVHDGREVGEQGAHAPGYNGRSVGICLVGVDTFTGAQMAALHALCLWLMQDHGIPPQNVIGHCETEVERAKAARGDPKDPAKTCPNLDMDALRVSLGALNPPELQLGRDPR